MVSYGECAKHKGQSMINCPLCEMKKLNYKPMNETDYSKPAEELAQEFILMFMIIKQTKDSGWAGMNMKMATKCALIHVEGLLEVCPEFIDSDKWDGTFAKWEEINNPVHTKLTEVLLELKKK